MSYSQYKDTSSPEDSMLPQYTGYLKPWGLDATQHCSTEDTSDPEIRWHPPERTTTFHRRRVQNFLKTFKIRHWREGEPAIATLLHLPKIIHVLFPTWDFLFIYCDMYYICTLLSAVTEE
jgi:hypothetical protein